MGSELFAALNDFVRGDVCVYMYVYIYIHVYMRSYSGTPSARTCRVVKPHAPMQRTFAEVSMSLRANVI